MKKVFITGGSGFIGRNLKEQLGHKYDISAPSSHDVNLTDADKTSEFIKKNNFDVIIHAANWNSRSPHKSVDKILEYNIRMFFNIARCKDHYGRLIYYGSGAEYGKKWWLPRMSEDYFDEHVPDDAYGFSKYIMTKYAEGYDNICNLRLFGVFGKYEDWQTRFISNMCCQALFDMPLLIRQNVFFDYLYIDDLVAITDLFITKSPVKVAYNICTGRSYDLLSRAEMVLKAAGKNIEIRITKPGLGAEYSGNNSRFISEFGEFVFSRIDAGIQKLYDWYMLNKNMIDPGKLGRLPGQIDAGVLSLDSSK